MADIRGFTNISSHRAPEEVVTMVNNFLSVMTDVIITYGGTIDEFIGDAILVLFGAPNAMTDHAEKAVACAIGMEQAMTRVNELNLLAGLPEIGTGIGINTGEVIVGNIGSEKRAKYGVVGHHVNFTARIESYTPGGQILISERTRVACGSMVQTRGEISVRPKGIDEEVRLFDVASIGAPYDLAL